MLRPRNIFVLLFVVLGYSWIPSHSSPVDKDNTDESLRYIVAGRISQKPMFDLKTSESSTRDVLQVDSSIGRGSSSSSSSSKRSKSGLDLYDLGPADPHAMHTLMFSVKQRNIDNLPDLIAEVSFGMQSRPHYSREEVAALTANPEASAAVMSFLSDANKDGNIVIDTGPYGEHIKATAPVHLWSSLLKTQFRNIQVAPIETSSSSSSIPRDPSLAPKNVVRALEYSLPETLVSQLEDVHGTIQIPALKKQFGKVIKKLSEDEVKEYEEFTSSNDYGVLSSNSFLRAGKNFQEIHLDSDEEESGGIYRGSRKHLQSVSMDPTKLRNRYNIGSSYEASENVSQVILTMLDLTLSEGDLSLFQDNIVQISGYSETVDTWYRQPDVDFYQDRETGTCLSTQDCTEPNLDMQYIMATARNAHNAHHYFDDVFYWVVYMNSLSDTDIPKVGSISYGYLEDQLKSVYASYLNSFNIEVMKLALRGVTVLAASGDDGVANFQARNDPSLCGYNPSFPASNPYVTAVGGTQGRESDPNATEVNAECSVSGITAGGGFSEYWDMPDWQKTEVETYLNGTYGQAAVTGYGKSTNSGRGYPDISLAANSYVVYNGGNTYLVSGTSASSPVMAGLITLVNEHRVSAGGSTLGFVNPALYRNASQYKKDVTSGHNRCTAADTCNNCCNAGFTADTGWDPVTGLGYLDFSQFFFVFTGVEMVTDLVIPPEEDDDGLSFDFLTSIYFIVVVVISIFCGIYFTYQICTQRRVERHQPHPVQQQQMAMAPVPIPIHGQQQQVVMVAAPVHGQRPTIPVSQSTVAYGQESSSVVHGRVVLL